MKALVLSTKLDPIVLTDEFGRGHWKPHPLSYQTVMEKFRRPPSDYVYIGDNPLKDFVTAKKRGWRTVQVRRKKSEYGRVKVAPLFEADFTVPTLFELAELKSKF